jgi:hypothetical protein
VKRTICTHKYKQPSKLIYHESKNLNAYHSISDDRISACQKQEAPETPESVAVITQPQPKGESAEAGKRAVTIAATAAWTATSNSAWLTVSPASGEKGMQEVILSFQENTSTEARTGVVTFTSGTYSETFTLVQNGAAATPAE